MNKSHRTYAWYVKYGHFKRNNFNEDQNFHMLN